MSRRVRIKLSILKVIVISWMLVAVGIALYDHMLLKAVITGELAPQYQFIPSLLFNLLAAFIASVLGGGFLVFYVQERYRDKPYGFTILAVCLSFITIVIFITVLFGIPITMFTTGKPFRSPEAQAAYRAWLVNPLHFKNIIVWSVVVALTQLMIQVNSKFGHGALWNLITGKYHRPKSETRIFMFVDLNSSTTIAEQLGDEKYHELLRDFFADITNPILDNRGEIYQYVGDEVVVAWKHENGKEHAHCLKCFFDMKKEIADKNRKYLSRYGLIPEFKAGIHYGKVIAGEIGIIKRDITFSGDVLNTTSRIQSKCKEFNVEVLTSTDLLSELAHPAEFESRPLGTIKLRGKEKEVELSTVSLV